MKTKNLGPLLFNFVSTLTPIIAVEALIKNEQDQILLTWRDDKTFGQGWHVPGSILRLGETLEQRLHMCVRNELSSSIRTAKFLEFQEGFREESKLRPHTILFIYLCTLSEPLSETTQYTSGNNNPSKGQWAWFTNYPENMLPEHSYYQRYFTSDSESSA